MTDRSYSFLSSQTKTYFDTLHENDQKGGVYEYVVQGKHGNLSHKSLGGCINILPDLLYKGDYSYFVTLNSYRKPKNDKKSIRNNKDLWGLDCIMIDIDGDCDLCGKEPELIENLSWFWKEKKLLPEPNLYSFTGGGGIHLYYTFQRLPKNMANSINNLKKLFANAFEELDKAYGVFPYITNTQGKTITYKVDKRCLDSQRYDRIPGSVNPKTGNTCVCFKTEAPRYTLQELYAFAEEFKKEKKKTPKKQKTTIKTSKRIPLARVFNKRIKGLFALQKNGKDFQGCREYALFILASSARQLGYSYEETSALLNKFNNGFEVPLRACELNAILRKNKVYKFTNEYIKNVLNISEEEEKYLFSEKRPGDRKERTFNNRVNIAKLVIKGKTISEIAKLLGVSESLVKRVRCDIKRLGGFIKWAGACDKKKIKKIIENLLIKFKNNELNRFFSAAVSELSSFATEGSFCNVYNILCKSNKQGLPLGENARRQKKLLKCTET
ncbi:MAG: helix-turn-helix domain-containing protein [Candidatus Gastranaerophilaceae bacterium]